MVFRLEQALEESGALTEGHFLLSSGKHSDRYVEKFHLLRKPVVLEQVCAAMIEKLGDTQIDVVAGPTTGGILIAAEIARQLGVRAAYAERSDGAGLGREFRRVNYFEPGDRVMVVDDILTTGGSVRETILALRPHPVDVAAVMVMVDRSMGRADLGAPYQSLTQMDVPAWEPEGCPLCEQGMPLVKPGTTAQSS
ncbi:MAG: orotate phosphoribosyltransferase [Thermomicrobiaceae bacterium]